MGDLFLDIDAQGSGPPKPKGRPHWIMYCVTKNVFFKFNISNFFWSNGVGKSYKPNIIFAVPLYCPTDTTGKWPFISFYGDNYNMLSFSSVSALWEWLVIKIERMNLSNKAETAKKNKKQTYNRF